MPKEGAKPFSPGHLLTDEEILNIVEAASDLGVRKIRITGGEPLIRENIQSLIKEINNIAGIEDISLTTNGMLLEKYAEELACSGLSRVNISLDSLIPERYFEITRGRDIEQVFRGIHAAEKAGLLPVKINMVPIRGINDDEIEDFARLTLKTSYQVRFIEFMPVGKNNFWGKDKYVPTDEIKERVEAIAPLTPVKLRRSGPARYYRLKDAKGVIGFISAITHHFCDECNRLRLTSEGKIRPCLFSETEIDLRSPVRYGASREEIKRLLNLAIKIKPKSHHLNNGVMDSALKPMSKIGG